MVSHISEYRWRLSTLCDRRAKGMSVPSVLMDDGMVASDHRPVVVRFELEN